MKIISNIEPWAASLIADPISKIHRSFETFLLTNGIPDARVFLPNTPGYKDWKDGQEEFEAWERTSNAYENQVMKYVDEIFWDKEVYSKLKMREPILDVGGHVGTIREFLPIDIKLFSIDPYIAAVNEVPDSKYEAYSCLKEPLNFVAGMAEFLPIISNAVGTVHMRSMLDHVQIPDLAIIEAYRVLQSGGQLIIGMSIEGAPYGESYTKSQIIKLKFAKLLGKLGVKRFSVAHDHHTWHPTLVNLRKLIEDNGFLINEQFWQERWKGRVVYICALKE